MKNKVENKQMTDNNKEFLQIFIDKPVYTDQYTKIRKELTRMYTILERDYRKYLKFTGTKLSEDEFDHRLELLYDAVVDRDVIFEDLIEQ